MEEEEVMEEEVRAGTWPPRTCLRLYRLRLVTFEPLKLQEAVSISGGRAGVSPAPQRGHGRVEVQQLFSFLVNIYKYIYMFSI